MRIDSVYEGKIAWYDFYGASLFSSERVISTNADGASSVFAIDMDGDGDIDVLSASSRDNKIAWYENDGYQEFTEHTISTSALGANSVFAIDVDGDGDIDVLSASFDDGKIAWYENMMIPPTPTVPPTPVPTAVPTVSPACENCAATYTPTLALTSAPTAQSLTIIYSSDDKNAGLFVAILVISSIILVLLSAILFVLKNKNSALVYPTNDNDDELSKPISKRLVVRRPTEENEC